MCLYERATCMLSKRPTLSISVADSYFCGYSEVYLVLSKPHACVALKVGVHGVEDDGCRIRTCAANASRFRVCLLNHSDKPSVLNVVPTLF
jgi:hypothetical protein